MKITAIEIKPGMIIEHKNDYWNVLKTQHVKPGKGGAFNQVELKSLIKAGAKYIAISSFIWDNPKLKPEFAIKKFK